MTETRGPGKFRRIRDHIRHNIVGYLALFVALSATAWAAPKLAKDSVKSKQIKDGQVKSVDVADNGLTGTDIDESTLDVSGTAGPKGATGAQGPQGATGPAGTNGTDGSPDTGAQILAKLLGVDGSGSNLDADRLDGQDASAFSAAGHTHTGGDIVNGTITDADISNTAAIAESKLATQMGVMTGRINGLTTFPNQYGGASGATDASFLETDVTSLSPDVAMTASGLALKITAAPGMGEGRIFTLRANGGPTGIGCIVSNANTTCNSGTVTEVIPAGAELSIHVLNSPGATAADALFGWRLR